jgi:predicted DCC family thiol-disulfide oxidoreductase YuxK
MLYRRSLAASPWAVRPRGRPRCGGLTLSVNMFTNINSRADLEPQPNFGTEGRHLLLYDGVCGLCSRLVQFVLARDRYGVFHFAPLQSPTGKAVVEPSGAGDPATFWVIANYRTPLAKPFTKGRAALFVINELGWPWKMAGLLGVLPTALLDRLYDVIARNRYRAFGRHDGCLIPRAEYRSRFIDS